MTNSLVKTILKTSAIAAIAGAALTTQAAAGQVKNVQIKKIENNFEPIHVKMFLGQYVGTVEQSYQFKLKLKAKAKFNKKIKSVKLTSGKSHIGIPTVKWNKYYASNAKLFHKNVTINVPLNKITWQGPNPIKACQLKMAKNPLVALGGTTAIALAKFELAASIKPKHKTPNFGPNVQKKASISYPIQVQCMQAPILDKIING